MIAHAYADDVEQVVLPAAGVLGGGCTARRALPATRRRMVGPFVLLDRFGPPAPQDGPGLEVLPHPHIGLAALTYLFAGELVQRDSTGAVQAIRPGAAHLLVAGSGIVHAERGAAGVLCGVQSWVALPRCDEEMAAVVQHVPKEDLPCIEGEGIQMRLIAGSLHGRQAPTRCFSALFQADVALADGARFRIDAEHTERAVYVASGAVEVVGPGRRFGADRLVVFKPGAEIVLRAQGAARLLLLGGEKLPEKRHVCWNFVSSRRERIDQAARDWRDGRFAGVPGENAFMPLPEPSPFRL
jgi:redox-sensitive bicupin YhaK (pirin superfamily)